MRDVVKRWFPRSVVACGVVLAIGACSSEDDDGDLGGGTVAGALGSSGRTNGTSGSGSAGKASFGGSQSSGGGTGGGTSTGTAGRPGSGGSGAGGVVPECSGLPFTAGGDGGEESCVGVDYEAESVPADLFIMMDRSISQSKTLEGSDKTRWEALQDAVSAFAESAGDRDIRVGIGFFGRTGGRDDALDCDVDFYAKPVVEIAPIGEVGDQLVEAIGEQVPSGLTPTLPALEGAHQYAAEYAAENPERVVSVVLVTDGFPTQCPATASSAELARLAERARMTAPYVRTFVIGLAAEGNLNAIARSGGTNGAYLVDEGDTTASFTQALNNITNSPVPCKFEIPEPPNSSEVLNPDEVQVVYSPASGAPEEIPRLTSAATCSDQRAKNGGWYYDDNENPTNIMVCPCSCSRFGAGNVAIRIGCEPRVGIR